MSEERAVYDVGDALPASLNAFKSRACVQVYSSGNYVSPTPEEFDRLTKLAGWSQGDVAKLVGVSYNRKGSTTVRKWKTPVSHSENRTVPYAAWRYLLACAGVISVDDDLAALGESKTG